MKRFRLLHIAIPLVLIIIFFSFVGRTFCRAPWYEALLWNVIEPPQRLVNAISAGVGGVWSGYFAIVGAKKDNELLKGRIAGLEGKLIGMGEVERENERLKGLLNYSEKFGGKTIVARVVSNDPMAEFKSITINKGSNDGVRPLMPVVGPRGLVGKVGRTKGSASFVILLTDPNSTVDVLIQRSRLRGLATGSAWRTELKAGYYLSRLEYLERKSDIENGDTAVTSGLDTVYPPGLPVGTIHDIKFSRYGIFKEANIVPFENLSELQEVVVLTGDAK